MVGRGGGDRTHDLKLQRLAATGLALCPQPEVPIQTAQTVLPSFTSRDPRDNEPFWSSLRTRPFMKFVIILHQTGFGYLAVLSSC